MEFMCPGFMEWFCTTQAEVMCTTMMVSVRTRAGLGSPPEHFTTNSNESLNNLLKRKVDLKCSEWPQFNRILQGAVKEQQYEFEKALFGMGEYELVDEFKYLEVPHDKWIQMNVEQRKQKIQKAYTAKVQDSTGVLLALPSTENAESSSHKCLSVSIDDAKIGHVSQERIKGMWDKAEQLLSTEGFILPAAGAANTARQVASLTGQKSGKFEIPHIVYAHKHPVGMEVKSDCPVYQSAPNICQHALAAAEDLHILSDYLLWVCKTKKTLNVSQLISGSVPKDAGKKTSTRCKGAAKNRRKEPAEVTCVSLSLTCSIPVQESLLPTSLSSAANTIDFEEKSTILTSDCVSLSFPYNATRATTSVYQPVHH